MENIIKFDLNKMGYLDIESMYLVIDEFRNLPNSELIQETGFNTTSGYVYIALENGIQIASCFGNDVIYVVSNSETGDEFFLDTYAEAEEKQNNLSSI
tara:strand:- start:851 stop:1144 length:294 start_codon:yes stop_codon:yes gene_type:complete